MIYLIRVCNSALKVCDGGIIRIGKNNDERTKMIVTLANLDEPHESVPINNLIRIQAIPPKSRKDIWSIWLHHE